MNIKNAVSPVYGKLIFSKYILRAPEHFSMCVGSKGDMGGGPAGGFLITRHSQSSVAPDCPPTGKKLWVGHSLLSLGGKAVSTQDLG